MKMLLNNHFENAVESLKSNKVRTYLSIFGIMVRTLFDLSDSTAFSK